MIRTFIKGLLFPPKTDTEKLLAVASEFPRYTSHTFSYRDIKLEVTDFLSVAWQLKEFYEDGRMDFKVNKPNPVIYDCGSNVGVSVLYYKKLYPEAIIKAFEPDSNVFRCLKRNVEQNNIKDVQLFEKAIWKNNEGIEFGSEGADGGSVFFDGNKIKLPSIRLKDLLEKETMVDLLKMDIEGAEVEVLNDCKSELKKIKYLFVEYHSWKNQPQQLDQLLKNLSDNGFRYYIHSIHSTGGEINQPFVNSDSDSLMDIQLDIHAVNVAFKN